jgi:Flp pilus assembly protein TadD
MSVKTEQVMIPKPRDADFSQPKNHNHRAHTPNHARMYQDLAYFALQAGDVQARQEYLQMAQMFEQEPSL